MGTPGFDLSEAHEHFSADCFNNTWGLIDKPDRSKEEDEQMLLLAMSSVWHWTQREDHTSSNLSVGFWQVSRVHALLERGDEARRYGQMALEAGERGGSDPFTIGYAFEALARAEAVAGDKTQMAEYLTEAMKAAERVEDEEPKSWLLDDLKTIG